MNVTGIALGVSVALLWGTADTIAAIAARRLGTFSTTLVAQAGGFITLALVGVLGSRQMSLLNITPTALVLSSLAGVLLGIVGAGAYLGLYRSLELGPVVVVSPIVGGQGAVTLVLAVVFLHDRLDLTHLLLLLAILVGIVLTSTKVHQLVTQVRTPGAWISSGVRAAFLAMFCFGLLSFGFGAEATQTSSWFIVLFWARCFSLLFLTISTLVASAREAGQARQPRALGYVLAVSAGATEVVGYIVFSLAARLATTSVVGVCASLVPLIPLLYGLVALRERVVSNQIVGIALVLAGLVALPLDWQQGRWVLATVAVGTLLWVAVRLARRTGRSHAGRVHQGERQFPPWTIPAEQEAGVGEGGR